VLDALIGLEARARREDLARQYAYLREQLPALDIPAAVRAAFCRELSASHVDACDDVTVISEQPAAQVAKPAANLGPGAVFVRLSIEYARYMRFNEFRVIAALSTVTADHEINRPGLYAWYVTPGTDSTPASPLESRSKPNPRQQAAHAYWFDGSPGRMEKELLQSFSEVAGIVQQSIPHLANHSWNSLPTLGDLQTAGKISCKGASCKYQSLKVTDTRMWFVQMADAPVVMSVPLELWR
jgi:hypothetical protein